RLDARAQSFSERMLHAPRLTSDLRSDRGKQTAGPGMVAMTRRQVRAHRIGEGRRCLTRQTRQPPFTRDRSRGALRREVLLGLEVAVEASVREASLLHDVRHSDAVVASLTEEPAGQVENPFAIRRRLLARHSHDSPPTPERRLTAYMMLVINNT